MTTEQKIHENLYSFIPRELCDIVCSYHFPSGLDIGDECYCLDKDNLWCRAIVIKKENNKVFMHFQGWAPKWQEWLDLDDEAKFSSLSNVPPQVRSYELSSNKYTPWFTRREAIEYNKLLTNIKFGRVVECYYLDKWHQSLILYVNGNSAKVKLLNIEDVINTEDCIWITDISPINMRLS